MLPLLHIEFERDVDRASIERFVGESAETAAPRVALSLFDSLNALPLVSNKHVFERRPNDVPAFRDYVVQVELQDAANLCQTVKYVRSIEGVRNVSAVPVLMPASSGDELAIDSETPVVGKGGVLSQWYLHHCNAFVAWHEVQATGDVVVVDIDWGFNLQHPEFGGGRVALSLNLATGKADVGGGSDHAVAHGTGSLGLIGAPRGNGGMIGFAPDATLWAFQASNGEEGADDIKKQALLWSSAIDRVTRDRAGRPTVINIEAQSAERGRIDQVVGIRAAIDAAICQGIVVCLPAGNGDKCATIDDCGTPFTPSGAIVVGATNDRRHRWTAYRDASNYGPSVTVAAPGVPDRDTTCSADLKNPYTNGYGGTSGACAKVAGAAALILQANPALRHRAVKNILESTGMKVLLDQPVGHLLDCLAAVRMAKETPKA